MREYGLGGIWIRGEATVVVFIFVDETCIYTTGKSVQKCYKNAVRK